MKRKFDAKVWHIGTSKVITIPRMITDKLELEEGDIIEVTIKK